MKIQLDSVQKIIRVEETVNFGELIKYLDKLLPKNSPLGSWKDYKLETNTIIYNWNYPIYVNPFVPISPSWHIPDYTQPLPINICHVNSFVVNSDNVNAPSTLTNGIYNLQLN